MGVFKNEVGRPSNEVIKKRNILKVVCFILVVIILLLVAYIVNDKGLLNNNKTTTTKNIKETTTTQKIESFDISKIIVNKEKDDPLEFGDVYVYDKKVDIKSVLDIGNVKSLDDIAVFEANYPDHTLLVIVDKKGEILYKTTTISELYCSYSKVGCYGYKVNDNKITFTTAILGQDPEYVLCNSNSDYNFYEYEMTYENGILSSPKVITSMTAKDIINKYNIDCK